MTMNPLPPQAYTKDTLLKAYHWLQTQPPSIREMAMTPDIMVSLFLKASRDGDQALERPSIQNFKSELRNLAGLMGELEGPVSAPAPLVGAATMPPLQETPKSPERPPAPAAALPPTPPAVPAPQPHLQTSPPSTRSGTTPSVPPRMEPAQGRLVLDPKSLEMVQEIRSDFNLSNDSEALRMLIKIGYTKAKPLLS